MKSKYFLVIAILYIVNFPLFSQKYEPNYPHTSSGSVENHYSIIIGSMLVSENAEKLKETAIFNGFECEIIPVNIKNKLYHRVCVGKYSTFNGAKEKINSVKKIFKISNAWILQIPSIQAPSNNQAQEKIAQQKQKEQEQKAAEQKRRADSIAQAQEKIAQQKQKEQEQKAAEQKRRADSIAQAQEKIAQQKQKEQKTEIVEKKEVKKTTETTKIAKSDEQTNAKNANLQSTVFTSDSAKKFFIAQLKQFIEAIKIYDYSKANEFIHPEHHLYVAYNIESVPSVREFKNFEKFFSVFSAFTSKGTSYDFSVDLENMMKKSNPRFENFPNYNCDKHSYSTNGMVISEINGDESKLVEETKKYYKSMNAELVPVMEERLQNAERLIKVAVIDADNKFIEGLYFANIDNKWYLIVMDLKIKCK